MYSIVYSFIILLLGSSRRMEVIRVDGSVSQSWSQARSIAALPAMRWNSAATALTGCEGLLLQQLIA